MSAAEVLTLIAERIDVSAELADKVHDYFAEHPKPATHLLALFDGEWFVSFTSHPERWLERPWCQTLVVRLEEA